MAKVIALMNEKGGTAKSTMEYERMEPFPNHKFKLYEGQHLADINNPDIFVEIFQS